jgi:hypothetical protein
MIHRYEDGAMEIEMNIGRGITNMIELIKRVSDFYNIIITPIFNSTRSPIAFIHPIIGQTFMLTKDFHKRKNVCDNMFNELHYDELKFRNQSWLKIAKLFMKYNNLGDFNDCVSNLSGFDRELYLHYPIRPLIARIDDDKYLQNHLKPPGTWGFNTLDMNKSRASILF